MLEPLLRLSASEMVLVQLEGGTILEDGDAPFAATEARSLQVVRKVQKWLEEGDYSIVKMLGCKSITRSAGLYFQTDLVTHEGSEFVVKKLSCNRASNSEKRQAMRDIEKLASLTHPNLMKVYEVVMKPGGTNEYYDNSVVDWIHFSMNYHPATLESKLKRAVKHKKAFAPERVMKWLMGAMVAFEFLHDLGMLHKNLKFSKLFLTRVDQVQVGGLEPVPQWISSQTVCETCDSLRCVPGPECLTASPYTWHCDLWSMGFILFTICALRPPLECFDASSMVRAIRSYTEPPPLPPEYQEVFGSVCRRMMSRDCALRPSARQVVEEVKRSCQDASWHDSGSQSNKRVRKSVSDPSSATKRRDKASLLRSLSEARSLVQGFRGYKLRSLHRCIPETSESSDAAATQKNCVEKSEFDKVVILPPIDVA